MKIVSSNLFRHYRPAFLLSLLMASPFLAGCPGNTADPAQYREFAQAFATGVVALDVTDIDRAVSEMTKATKTLPDEPAAWADLGVAQMRMTSPDYDAALKSLEQAQQLAPQNGRIIANIGLVETKLGKFAEALAALKKAVELEPDNLRALFAESEAITQLGGPTADADAAKLLDQILQKQPDNLMVLIEASHNAAKRGDQAAVNKYIATLTGLSKSWSQEAKDKLLDLTKAAQGNVRMAATQAIMLGHTLVQNIAYRQSVNAVTGGENLTGQVLYQPLKYPPLASTPSAPDTGLSYAVGPAPVSGKGGFIHAFYTDGKGNPVIQVGTDPFTSIDFDHDYQTDMASVGPTGFRLFQGKDGKFIDVTAKTHLPASVTKSSYTNCWAADVDMDGDLDLILASPKGVAVLQNNGDGTFKPIPLFSKLAGASGFAWGDIDGDGAPDAVFIDETGRLRLFSNERNGLFSERTLPGGLESIAAITLADLHGDGVLDIIALKNDGSVVKVSTELGSDTFTLSDLVKVTPGDGMRIFVADFDNNGSNDLAVSDSKQTVIFLSDTKGAFAAVPSVTVPLSTVDVADINGDGVLDLIGKVGDQPSQAMGKATRGYHYLAIRPHGSEKNAHPAERPYPDHRINSFGIGGEIEVRAGLLLQKQPILAPVVHFGLGEQTNANYLRIVWPDGVAQGEFTKTPVPGAPPIGSDFLMSAEQRLHSSCPFLFVWDGTKMAFVTDCIWRSPLGLKINAQATAGVAMTEDWVKIRGDQLKPRRDEQGNPYYDLRITADLWETHFFDHLALMTVDHPAGTDIWVDERFTVPPPPLAVITTTPVTPIAKATADTGEDMTETLRTRDGVYADYFGRGQYQGVTRDHTLTLDLGKRAKTGSGPLYLIAHGWLHPTNSSINVAISQGNSPPPTGLSIEVPDGNGGWKTAKAGLGFPAGKVKTVVIRVDDILNGGTVLRLRTNLEIYWDNIGWAHGVPNTPIQKQKLLPEVATLNYRGFTTVVAADKSSPELPVAYEPVKSQGQRWRDLIGYYTRYGDIRELLAKVDDRYVIMNAGDEIRMRFAVPPAPKPGYVRDFVLIGDGWVKDGDLNTTFSKTVIPLPTHSNPNYDRRPTTLEDDPVYQKHKRDWETYHTRYVTPDAFRDALRPDK
jgi:Tfp pilus assembly protein PilF